MTMLDDAEAADERRRIVEHERALLRNVSDPNAPVTWADLTSVAAALLAINDQITEALLSAQKRLAVQDEVQARDNPPALAAPSLDKQSRLISSAAECTGGSSRVPRASLTGDPRRCWLACGGIRPGQRRFNR